VADAVGDPPCSARTLAVHPWDRLARGAHEDAPLGGAVIRRHRGGLASREVVDAASSIGRSYATVTTTARTAHWSKQSLKELLTEKTTELKHFR